MKSLTQFITEAHKTFNYRIKIAGELDSAVYDHFKAGLEKYDLESISKIKKTPIQSDPAGFPGLKNQEINIFDIELNYPASIDEIRNVARLSEIDLNHLVVIDKEFNDSMNADAEVRAKEDGKVRLETPEYPENTKEQNDAKDAYASSYQEAAKTFAGEMNTDYEIAGDKTAPAKFNTDEEAGKDSPMTKVKRQLFKDIIR